MTDMDRFTESLLREAAGYNRPPATPADAMWPGVEGRLGAACPGLEAEVGDEAAAAGGPMLEALAYNASPPVPREEMWTRIEAAWALRRSAVGKGAGPVARTGARWLVGPGGKAWVAAVAAAASLVLGIALGRGTRPDLPAESANPTAPSGSAAVTATVESPATVAGRVPGEADSSEPIRRTDFAVRAGASAGAAREVHGEKPFLVAANPRPEPPVAPPPSVSPESATASVMRGPSQAHGPRATQGPVAGSQPEPEFDHVTAGHLGRAATLLTAFRTDRRTPASRQDLARWARELLVETRMFLGLPGDSGSPVEHALLADLELVLIQIAGLGPEAPDFEWDLARESMERRSTLMRLRAASTAGET